MSSFTFFRRPWQLVDLLQWTCSVKNLAQRLERDRIRKCTDEHVKWLETQDINASIKERLSV